MSILQIASVLKQARQQLVMSDSCRLDAELLLCHVLDCPRSYLYAHPEQPLQTKLAKRYWSLVEQRQNGEPIAHLTQRKEFWSLPLTVTKDTLIPRPETETLVAAALKRIPKTGNSRVLDLGTGSGAIALAIVSERPNVEITAIDCSKSALDTAKKNAVNLGMSSVHLLQSDWFKCIGLKKFDVIVSNPPYIASDDEWLQEGDVRFETNIALIAVDNGMAAIKHIVRYAQQHLQPNGWLLVEHGYQQSKAVVGCFIDHHYDLVTTLQDESGRNRVCEGQYRHDH